MKGAVLYQPKQPLVVEDIVVPDPHDDEVLVKVVATGVCHTDLHPIKGDMPIPLPTVLGHEGAGIVEKVGKGVTSVKPGDHVVLSVMPFCGKCRYCLIGKQYLCIMAWPTVFGGTLLNGSKRLKKKDGTELNYYFGQSSFADYALVHESTPVKVRDDAPLDKIAVLGCGATTGIGAVLNTANVQAGSSVAMFGCGGVGLSGIMAAKLVGAVKIIAVDVIDKKLEMARDFGATHTINSSKEDPVQKIKDLTGGFGADYSFEFIGNVNVMAQAFDATCPGGKTIIIGAAPVGQKVALDGMALLTEKTVVGTAGGSLRPGVDIPRYVDLYMEKKLDFDRLITRTYPLEDINKAFEAMEKGEVARSVIVF
jgi:Zn-dependent alcohol dehydrogenase